MSNYQKNSKYILIGMLVLMPLFLVLSCEDYTEETYILSDLEQQICDGLNDTLNHELDAPDLRLFGPEWTGKNLVENFTVAERIGSSWYDADFLVEPDVFIFTAGADTVATLQFLGFTYDGTTNLVDSVEIAYRYNPAGTSSFAGLNVDTSMAVGSDIVYISFSQGIVSETADWNIALESGYVSQSATGKVHRLENAILASVNTVPLENYVSDKTGFEVAVDYLSANSNYLTSPDSLLAVSLGSLVDGGCLLWDRQGAGSANIILNATDYLAITVWDAGGTVINPLDISMSQELIAYCHDLKTKAVYELTEQTYLIQFLPQEEMLTQDFHLIIMEDE